MSDGSIATIVTGIITVVTMIIGFLTMYVKLKYGAAQAEAAKEKAVVVEKKIDANTQLTLSGTEAATENAKIAATAATAAAEASSELAKQMNGALDARINKIVEKHVGELKEAFRSHNESDEQNMREIRMALSELRQQKAK